MTDKDSVALLEWALPRLRLRGPGFVQVRGQVCKRLRRRLAQLGLADMAAYRARLEGDAEEWHVLEGLCAVTISRFYRDGQVWQLLATDVLPGLMAAALGAGESSLRCWCVGCASGEEPYTLSILWALGLDAPRTLGLDAPPALRLRVLGTDVGEQVAARRKAREVARGRAVRAVASGARDVSSSQLRGANCFTRAALAAVAVKVCCFKGERLWSVEALLGFKHWRVRPLNSLKR